MASEMLLINPRRRRRAASPKRRRASPKRRRNPVAGRSTRARISRAPRRTIRRRNPLSNLRLGRRRRRRNPISLGGLNTKGLMAMLTDAAIGGAGAISMDVIMGQVNGFLPASFQTSKTTIGLGDAIKAGLTAFLGVGARRITKGLSMKMAQGALAVQAYELLGALVPAGMTLGYMSPARIVNGSARVGPNAMGAFLPAGTRSPLLNAYTRPGTRSPLLNGRTARQREGISTYR